MTTTTTTNSQYYEDQYNNVATAEQSLDVAYQESLADLDTENSSEAMITIMTSTLIIVSLYQEVQMLNDVVSMDALSTMENDENGIQADFDDYQEDWNDAYDSAYDEDYNEIYDGDNAAYSDDAGDQEASEEDASALATQTADTEVSPDSYVQDAEVYADDMYAIANIPEFQESLGGDVDNQLGTIFATDEDDSSGFEVDEQGTENLWEEAVGGESTETTQDSDYDTDTQESEDSAADTMQSITNGFSALSTDFSNQSSEAQSEMQYYESEDQQMQGLDETLMQEWASELQTMINNQLTS